MTAASYDLYIEQGTDWSIQLSDYTDNAGQAIDISSFTAKLQARSHVGLTATLFSLTSSPAAGIVINGGAGTITISLTKVQTAALSFSKGVYDLFLYDGSGVATKVMAGNVVLIPRVTS